MATAHKMSGTQRATTQNNNPKKDAKMEITELEWTIKMARAAKMLQLTADAADVTDTAREYNLLGCASTLRQLETHLITLAAMAREEADKADRRAAAAAAERKQAKKQATE